jgi:hypothetical protein
VDGQTIVDANKHFSIQNRYPTVANTRDALLDRPLAGNHDIAGSAGKKLQGIAEFTMA